MARLALALIAIVVLALSAKFTHTQLAPQNSSEVSSFQALGSQQALSSEFDLVAVGQQPQAPILHTNEDAPQPALIAYLALVLIGSVVAIGMVRHRARSEG